MNESMATEVDPLSTYMYPGFENYGYYPVKLENQNPYGFNDVPLSCPNNIKPNLETTNNGNVLNNTNSSSHNESSKQEINKNYYNNHTEPSSTQEDIKPNITTNGKRKIKKERSKYFNEKILEKDFPFYGCSVCNINFTALTELDSHVTIHKDRTTSYDLRIKSQMKKKKQKKEKKKNKKLKKSVKLENEIEIEVEIKPEDGYIGNEKASDVVNNTESDNQSLKENKDNGESSNSLNVTENVDSKMDIVDNKTKLKMDDETLAKKKELDNLQKIYKCFACQKQFTLSYYLKLHVRSHTDEKPYQCTQCGQSFITASKLGRHNKRFHLAIRYQCRICYRYFARFEFLTRHFDKKHPDDKLEGEPYDYNAILPYLKELEEQLREKAEKEKAEKKSDDWPGDWPNPNLEKPNPPEVDPSSSETIINAPNPPILELMPENEDTKDIKLEDDSPDALDTNHIDISIEEVKVDMSEVEVEVKIEADIDEPKEEQDASMDDPGDEVKDESDFKDETFSDDDYFPSNSWATSPQPNDKPVKPAHSTEVKCTVCEKTLKTPSYLRVHMRTHTGERPYKCYICNMGFITSSKMHRHVLTHPESLKEEDGVKVDKDEVKSEAENDDTEKTTRKRKKVNKTLAKFAKKKKTSEKKKKIYQKRPHSCDFCHKRYLHLETLQVHKRSHYGEQRVYSCTFCLSEQTDEQTLRTHEATHTGPKPYLCTLCGKTYKKRESMVYHRKSHKPEREYICDICTKSFSAHCKLRRHIASHAVERFVLRYECPVCAHMFNTRYHVQMHLASHQKEGLIHEENRNEVLAMVLQNARKIPKNADVPNLSDSAPADERSRVCNICGEIFQHFYYLEEHLKSHGSKIAIEDSEKAEEKKHICTVCNKGFKLQYYLKLHSFTHTKEKPFICQQCGKGFITRGKLKRHLETHTGLKKYQCHVCHKFFTRPSYLRIHVRTIHGTQDYHTFRMDKSYSLNDIGHVGV